MIALAVLAACSSTPTGSSDSSVPGAAPARQPKTLIFGVRYELTDIVPKITTGTSSDGMKRLFTASLAYMDGAGVIKPYLAEALPSPNTDSWQVFPDGRMETTYKLRPNLTWHDGTPITAGDFVFAWRVYATPEFGHANRPPMLAMEEVLAPDPHTVVARWKAPYPGAESLS